MMLILGILYTIGIKNYKDKDKEFLDSFNAIKIGLYITGSIFIICALPTFWEIVILGARLRFISWVVGIFITFFYRGLERFKMKML